METGYVNNFSLKNETALEIINKEYKKISIQTIDSLSIVSIAFVNDFINKLPFKLPKVGKSTFFKEEKFTILGMQPNQYFILFEYRLPDAAKYIKKLFKQGCYLTDQSDSWVILKISGEKSRNALERICPINLHTNTFQIGNVARTVMEHIGVIIYRIDEDEFFLISPRSSAKSFLHAVEISILNVQ